MKSRLFILLLLIISIISDVQSQTYGNEWIDYDQKYYYFPIVNTGIYKLDYATMTASGIPLSTFTSQNIQIFGREKEIPLFIEDGGDSSIDPGDYILFYAEKNDGWLDSTLYENPTWIGNPAYSLFNDTIQYFFSWNNSTSNSRYFEETSVDFSNYTPSNYILQKVESNYASSYNLGGGRITHAASSFFKGGEGFGLPQVNCVGISGGVYTLTLSIPTISPYTGSDAPLVKFQGISTTNSEANYSGAGNHHVNWKIGSSDYQLHDQILINYKHVLVNQNFSVNLLSSGNTPLKWSTIDDQGAAADQQSLNYWSIIYPKQPTLDGGYSGRFHVKNNPFQSKIRIDFTNTSVSSPLVFVHGSTPVKANLTSYNGGYSTLFYNSSNGSDQQVVIQDVSTVISVQNVKLVNGTGDFTNFLTKNPTLDSALLMIYHPYLKSSSMEYETYRKSFAGGAYNTLMAEIGELYLQFGGGINKHINGVRRFSHFIYDNSTVKPAGLFLMGKAISIANSRGSDLNCFVPTFGEPASDAAITSKLGGNGWQPLIPTGRLSVKTNEDLLNYLAKIVQYDAQQNPNSIYNSEEKDWQKQVMHLGGGNTASLQSSIQSYLNSMKSTIESANFAGHVQSVFKNTSAPIDPTSLSDATARIKNGISLMTFFGHSGLYNFDITLDDPVTWNNVGKYPILISNGCITGNMFVNFATPPLAEKYVNIPQGGAIAFIGAVSEGLDQPLSMFSNELYSQFSVSNYGKTLGKQIQMAIKSLETDSSNIMIDATVFQMNLLGDPMVKLNWHAKPEIELTPDRVSFSPQDLDYTVDSIEVKVILTNLGRAITDTFVLEIKRNFPLNSVDSIYEVKVPSLNYKDTVLFKMALQPNIGVGINNITVSADLPSFIPEVYDEYVNNKVERTLFVDIEGILPIIPYDFAVVPIDSVTVKASTVNPIADFNSYRFELDTTDLFNSSQFRYSTVSGLGGVKEVNPSDWKFVSNNQNAPLVCTDSTVYFWRVALDIIPFDWRERSFQYINGKEGWGQDHFFQFKKNGFSRLNYNRTDRERQFLSSIPDTLTSTSFANSTPPEYKINGLRIERGLCNSAPHLSVVIIDPVTHVSWGTRHDATGVNPNNDFGNLNNNGLGCVDRSMLIFNFPQTSVYLDSLISMINNHVPDSFYILIYSNNNTVNSNWSTELFNLFQELGSTQLIPSMTDGHFSFFCKKGDPSTVVEKLDSTSAMVEINCLLQQTINYGNETSTLIGPASRWGNVYWKQDSLDWINNDSTTLYIQAFDIHGALQYEINNIFTPNDSILDLNTLVNASLFPFIKLRADYTDTLNGTPAQIDRWHVLFDPLPEAAIDGTSMYTWLPAKDTLDEGETIKFAVDVKNIFTLPMDSLLINYWIEDNSHIMHPILYSRQDSLLVNEVFRDTIEFSTLGYSGINSLWMEVNPYVNGSIYITDQPEQEHFNNLLQVPFNVRGDDINPILDVTFDGRHILNGDIISPTSEIFITLKDDNPMLIMDNVSDTTLFGIYITDPSGFQKRIPFVDGNGNVVMQWVPADAQNKRFKIIYPALFSVDGKYTLLVQGTDRSGNLSGDIQYKIMFEVIRESSITYLMNYPNPFSTSTRFVFTLTGSEVPENIIIQIMTVTGKVVREITESELGPIYIGRNISEYDWNGTDEFGDPLANGVYLYRVKSEINGENIKHRDSGADSYFTKDFGKMYILR